MPFPVPPADHSGGYMIIKYSDGADTHRMRLHVRDFDAGGVYTSPTAGSPGTVMADFTAFAPLLQVFYGADWVISLDSIWKNNGDGTFTQIVGYTPPATFTGTHAGTEPNDQTRAAETILNFRDGFGGRMRVILIGSTGTGVYSPKNILGGNPTGTAYEKIIDHLSVASKSNIVSHNGHVVQSPASLTQCVNRRLRRHYGFA